MVHVCDKITNHLLSRHFNAATPNTSRFWIPSSLIYADIESEVESDFGGRFDPSLFDEIEEPPPVHILYPRPAYNHANYLSITSDLPLTFLAIVCFLMNRR